MKKMFFVIPCFLFLALAQTGVNATETTCTASSDPSKNTKGCVPCSTGDCCESAFSMVGCRYTAVIIPQE